MRCFHRREVYLIASQLRTSESFATVRKRVYPNLWGACAPFYGHKKSEAKASLLLGIPEDACVSARVIRLRCSQPVDPFDLE
jgi:hypothetical protein